MGTNELRGDTAHYAAELERLYSETFRPLLILLNGKVPVGKEWNERAIKRFQRFDPNLYPENDTGMSLAEHLANGRNVGWVVPPSLLVIDCDSLATDAFISGQLLSHFGFHSIRVPVQESRPNHRHFVVRLPPDIEIDQASRYLPCGRIDLRVAGKGQIVVEPSTHPKTGKEYRWIVPLPEHLEDVPEIPGELLKALIDAPTTFIGNLPGTSDDSNVVPIRTVPRGTSAHPLGGAVIPKGSRNQTLIQKAGAMRDRCDCYEELEGSLLGLNAGCCKPPLQDGEVRTIARSAWAYELKERAAKLDEDGNRKPHYAGFWADEAADVPVRTPLVKGLAWEGDCGVIFGPSGSLKTALVMNLAASVAQGSGEWFGKEIVQGGTLYVAAEGGGGMRERCLALLLQYPRVPKHSIRIVSQVVRVNEKEATERLEADLRDLWLPKMPQPLRLVVFDTYSQSTPGVPENDSEAFTVSESNIRRVLRIAGETQTPRPVGLLVHHPNKSGEGARGTSAMTDNLDFVIETSMDSGHYHFQVMKVKDAEAGWAKPYKMVIREVGSPIEKLTSIVVEETQWPGDESEKEPAKRRKSSQSKRKDIDG